MARCPGFYPKQELDQMIDQYRAESSNEITRSLLKTETPDILFVIAEGYTRQIMDHSVDGRAVMPYMNKLASEGVLFHNMYANGVRTDKGVAAVMSGFPTQPKLSIMKIPAKTRHLHSVASSLKESYQSHFFYGGDLNFMDMSSYLYATGWDNLLWQRVKSVDEGPRSWGYSDGVMCELVADEFISLTQSDNRY